MRSGRENEKYTFDRIFTNSALKEFPRAKPEEIAEGKGLYKTVYTKLSPNTDII